MKAKLGAPPPAANSDALSAGESADYAPLGWESYFEKMHLVSPEARGPDCQFAVFEAGAANTTGPVFFLIHGAGHTAMSWALVAVCMAVCALPCLSM